MTPPDDDLDQPSSRHKSRSAFRWMIALLVALAVGAIGWLAFFRASPESLVDPPAEAKTPSVMPR